MAGSINKVMLIGNLGKDPEERTFQNGDSIVNLSIATSDRWKDKMTGEAKERTEWHKVVIENDGLVKVARQYLKKGSCVYVEGKLVTRKYQDQSGQDRYVTEIRVGFTGKMVMISGSRQRDDAGHHDEGAYERQPQRPLASEPDLDDDIPF